MICGFHLKLSEEAAESVEIAWNAAQVQGLPWLDRNSTLEGHLQVLRGEDWGSRHHLHFQIGVVEAMLGLRQEATADLVTASRLYAEDGRSWCPAYIKKAEALIDALDRDNEATLLEQWHRDNLAVHRMKS